MATIDTSIPTDRLIAGAARVWFGAGRETSPGPATTTDRFLELHDDDQARCEECGAPPDAYCTRGCPAQDTATRGW